MPEEDEPSEEYNFKDWKVADLRDFASKNNIKVPTKAKKADIIKILEEVTSSSEFVDRTQEAIPDEELETELIAGEEFDPALLTRDKMELKFWQKPPFSSLLDPEVAKDSNVAFYDLAALVDKYDGRRTH